MFVGSLFIILLFSLMPAGDDGHYKVPNIMSNDCGSNIFITGCFGKPWLPCEINKSHEANDFQKGFQNSKWQTLQEVTFSTMVCEIWYEMLSYNLVDLLNLKVSFSSYG